jgi:NADH:ubiquinone reductase (H+-translocating)
MAGRKTAAGIGWRPTGLPRTRKAGMNQMPDPETNGPARPGAARSLVPHRGRRLAPQRATAGRLHVVIVGGGFGGLTCARALDGAEAEVVLIDRDNYHLFTPLLYQVASALLKPSDIAFPLRKVFRRSRNVRFRQGAVTQVDFRAKLVGLHDGTQIGYDVLVLATGSANNYFSHPLLARHTIGMKRLGEAMRLRNHVLSCLEMAARTADPGERRAWLTFVVAGGGPTGVEYAGALGELLRLVLGRDYPELSPGEPRIVLAEGAGRLLGEFCPRLGDYARLTLARRGVDVRLSTLVESADEDWARLSTGEILACRTVVWSAGVRPADPAGQAPLPRTAGRRLQVDEHLRVPGVDGVFAIGDAAAARWNNSELPMLSPPAMQEGRHVARVIRDQAAGRARARKPFRYIDKGIMATIGRNSAVAQIGPLRLRGFAGWVAWLTVHLYYLVGFRNRLAVLCSWSWNYLRKDRPVRIIARSDADTLTDAVESATIIAPSAHDSAA